MTQNASLIRLNGRDGQQALAAEARAGGRLITAQIISNIRVDGENRLADLADVPQPEVNAYWKHSMNPAYATSGRKAWAEMARAAAGMGRFPDTLPGDRERTFLTIDEAQAMFDWPIYRAALRG